jgi:uncharacterized protein (TIGR04255 family)
MPHRDGLLRNRHLVTAKQQRLFFARRVYLAYTLTCDKFNRSQLIAPAPIRLAFWSNHRYDSSRRSRPNMHDRPTDLPDFANPPLDEVVLGVQFEQAPGYTSVMAKDVWSLYSDEFPRVQELPAIAPQFEVFGRESARSRPNIRIESAPLRGRLWFISKDENHLIQFQDDRLLLNWRRKPNGAQYPRFEGTSSSFIEHLNRLNKLFIDKFGSSISVNQAEISYINIIPVSSFSEVGRWIEAIDFHMIDIEGVNLNFAEVVKDTEDKPYARLQYELGSAYTFDGKKLVLRLSLTFRGRPASSSAEQVLEFLRQGRNLIVGRFAELTTTDAHKEWGRKS